MPGRAASFLGGRFGGGLLIRGVQVEINPAQRAVLVRLAQNNGDLSVQRDAVPQVRGAGFIGLDGLLHERVQGVQEHVGRFVQADNKLIISLLGLFDLAFECINSHKALVLSLFSRFAIFLSYLPQPGLKPRSWNRKVTKTAQIGKKY